MFGLSLSFSHLFRGLFVVMVQVRIKFKVKGKVEFRHFNVMVDFKIRAMKCITLMNVLTKRHEHRVFSEV